MKISIIIPAYNLERYIYNCLKSVLDQDLDVKEYEVLIINDGSTDKTGEIVREIISHNKHLLLFERKNQGVSSARNLGIEKAKGKYILFVDGDDWLEKNTLGSIYEKMSSNNLEIGKFGYHKVDDQGIVLESSELENDEKSIRGIDFLLSKKTSDFFPWLYCVSAKLLKASQIRFNTELSFCEDKEFMVRLFSKTERFQSFELHRYNYRLGRQDGATTVYSNKHVEHLIKANILIYQFAEELEPKTFKTYLQDASVWAIESSFYRITIASLYQRFGFWSSIVLKHIRSVPGILEKSAKLRLLNQSLTVFYLRYYLPRSVFHKIKKQFIA
ncbi:glycosyltransferase [Flagellimonas sp. HMM57]|uniref:glycosyltransferase family 2 protein n=1 Tax=unclassified Flagellimonas TaxID=2644544 RepID=UPI0013D57787|nr:MULTISPECIES: glycosyltransferase family 2 protein [unclassified Flagellimonas]UII76124.1 glycosyltransferase [Flagellimonas sp. HMM57]